MSTLLISDAERHFGESNYEHTGQQQYSNDGDAYQENYSARNDLGYTDDHHNYNSPAQETKLGGNMSSDEGIHDKIENTGYSGSWGNEMNKGTNSNYNGGNITLKYNDMKVHNVVFFLVFSWAELFFDSNKESSKSVSSAFI